MTIGRTHRQCVGRLLGLLPRNPSLLDAPCGTGVYWDILLGAGCEVLGVDPSAEALTTAQARHPDVATQRWGLDELPFDAAFDGALCIAGLDPLPQNRWPNALGGLHRAVRRGGVLYLTVLPARHAERDEVRRLMKHAGFRVEDEIRGDGRDHLLARRR